MTLIFECVVLINTLIDITAIFGVIWRWFHRRKVYLTIKEFQEGVKVSNFDKLSKVCRTYLSSAVGATKSF